MQTEAFGPLVASPIDAVSCLLQFGRVSPVAFVTQRCVWLRPDQREKREKEKEQDFAQKQVAMAEEFQHLKQMRVMVETMQPRLVKWDKARQLERPQ